MEGNTIQTIYKICGRGEWAAAETAGVYVGSTDDARDGYIHFSTAGQARGTAAKFFQGRSDLLIAAIDPTALGAALKWVPSRGGQLFPHLYGQLALRAVIWVKPLPLGNDGAHQFPEEMT